MAFLRDSRKGWSEGRSVQPQVGRHGEEGREHLRVGELVEQGDRLGDARGAGHRAQRGELALHERCGGIGPQMIGGDDDRVILSFEEAVAMLPDGETVHIITNPSPGALIGADWEREDVIALLRTTAPELSGPDATRAGHAMCVHRGGRWMFIETRRAES